MASRAIKAGGGGVLLMALCALGVAEWRRPPVPPPVPVQAPVPEAPPPVVRSSDEAFVGVIIAEESVDLTPRVQGRLAEVRVQVGDRVRQGDVVAALETQPLQQERAVAEAGLLSARAELQVAELALSEAQERLQRREDPKQLSLGAISQEELARVQYEQRLATARRESSRARVQEREAQLTQLQQRLAESSLRAPFDARVASRYMDPGAVVSPGQTVVHLLREGAQRVRFAVPQEDVARVTVGLPVRVRVAEGGEVLSGQVSHVAPEVDVASGMVIALAHLEAASAPRPLPTGTVAWVEVLRAEASAKSPAAPAPPGQAP